MEDCKQCKILKESADLQIKILKKELLARDKLIEELKGNKPKRWKIGI